MAKDVKKPRANNSPSPPPPTGNPASELKIMRKPGVSDEETLAGSVLYPHVRHAFAVGGWGARMFPGGQPGLTVSVGIMTDACDKARNGDLSNSTDMLVAQAMTLDAVFTEMLRRASMNIAEYPDATDRYMRLAFKAQAQSRATIEALGKLARGGEQVVRHIHVDNRGGQAVIAENVHTGGRNAIGDEQPFEPGASTTVCSEMLGPDPLGHGMPMSGNAEWAVQDPRR